MLSGVCLRSGVFYFGPYQKAFTDYFFWAFGRQILVLLSFCIGFHWDRFRFFKAYLVLFGGCSIEHVFIEMM